MGMKLGLSNTPAELGATFVVTGFRACGSYAIQANQTFSHLCSFAFRANLLILWSGECSKMLFSLKENSAKGFASLYTFRRFAIEHFFLLL